MKNNLTLTTILQELVKIKSLSGQEQKLADWIINFAIKNNISHYIVNNNVVLTLKNNATKCLIFNGHMDTVSAGNISQWENPPYGENSAVIKNGKLFGLGASDMKASLACFLYLAQQLSQQKTKLDLDLYYCFVTNEETTGQGSQEFVTDFMKKYAKNYQKIGAVIGEPTDNQKLEIGNKGNAFIRITTKGKSGHSSQPIGTKFHSIYKMMKVILAMDCLSNDFKNNYEDKILGVPSICLTSINTPEISLNQISDICVSNWDIRTTPNMHSKVKQIIEKKLQNLGKVECLFKPAPASLVSNNSYLVKLFKNVNPNINIGISQASNDSCFFTQQGIEAVVFGPGQKKVVHQINEYVELEKLNQAVGIYQQIIKNY